MKVKKVFQKIRNIEFSVSRGWQVAIDDQLCYTDLKPLAILIANINLQLSVKTKIELRSQIEKICERYPKKSYMITIIDLL